MIHQENIPFCLQGTRKTRQNEEVKQNHNATPGPLHNVSLRLEDLLHTSADLQPVADSLTCVIIHYLLQKSTDSCPLRASNAARVYLLEEMKMGCERRTDGGSATRGARVSVELPNNVSALPDVSVLSEPSKTSVQGPAATSIMLPAEKEEGGRSRCQPRTSRLPGVFPLLANPHANYR